MHFKTKRTRARRPGADHDAVLSGSYESKTVVEIDQTPYVLRNRTVDLCVGNTKVGDAHFRVGQRTFPAYYGHRLGFIGETIDAKRSGDGESWLILLTGVFRGSNGEPVLDGDREISIDGWYRESDLFRLDGVDSKLIFPGHSKRPSEILNASHTQKLTKKACKNLPADLKIYAETLWRLRSYYAERPLELKDPDWAFKLQCICRLFGWLRR